MKLILASTSPYRKKLLAQLGIPFEVVGSDFNERQFDHLFSKDPLLCATKIAYGKALTVFQKLDVEDQSTTWVLGADQIVWMRTDAFARLQFHKPGTPETALDQLMTMRGRMIFSTTGLILLTHGASMQVTSTEELDVRNFSEAEARAYVETFQPLDCAGSFRMSDAGITLFSFIRGDWTGCQGFPLLKVCELLRGAGILPA